MRVAHFAKYTFVQLGGMERHVAILSKALAAHGIDVTVFAYDPSRRLEPGTVEGVRLEPIPPPAPSLQPSYRSIYIVMPVQSLVPCLAKTRGERRVVE